MPDLILRAVVIGAIVTVAALLLERGLTHLRVGKRHAWTFALLATSLAPWLPRVTPARVEALSVLEMPTIVVNATSQAASRMPIDMIVLGWLLLSLVVVSGYGMAYVKLLLAKREWRRARIAQDDVFMSDRFGPAVFGFVVPRIVVPRWIENASADEQALIVLHEREHIRAGDQQQLLLSIVCTALLPWHPFVWWQARRLRFAIEADCDQRVLAAAPDRAQYASLLVKVGSRQSGLLLTPALAEHRNGLEARVRMLTNRLVRNRWKAAGLIVAGLVVAFVACEARLPNDPQEPMRVSLPRVQGDPPVMKNAGELVARHYPPTLRAAGIGGTVGMEVTVRTDGSKDNYALVKTSGHDALDRAAEKVVREMELLPMKVPAGQQPKDQTYSIFIEFSPKAETQRVPETEPAPWLREEVRPRYKTFLDSENPPYSRHPELLNRDEVMQSVERNYPPLLRSAGIEGKVMVQLLVGVEGTVLEAHRTGRRIHEALDSAALRVVRGMKFTPAQYKGEPVQVLIELPIEFKTK